MSVVKNIEIENQNYDIYGKNIQPVTWQEYEAIEDKNDDKAYFITDVPPSEQKKTAVKPLPTGSISTVTDAAELPLNALKVSVEAQQDLHGYDHPWVGGAGKNKLPLTVENLKAWNTSGTWSGNAYEIDGMTFTILTDDANNVIGIDENGTTTSYPSFRIFNGTLNGSYRLCKNRTRIRVYSDNAQVNDGANDYPFAASGETYEIYLFPGAGTTDHHIAKPMLVISTETNLTFEPYSNICPISGWDSGEIMVCDDIQNPTQTETIAQQFPTTIYGAEWDVVKGKLTLTHKIVVLNTANMNNGSSYPGWRNQRWAREVVGDNYNDRTDLITLNVSDHCYVSTMNNNDIVFFNPAEDGITEAQWASMALDVQFCYPLATPTTIQLSPLSIRLLENTNNLYADCGEVLEGEYFGNNTNQIRVNDEIIAGGNSVTFAAESKYAEHAEVAEVANNIQNIDYNDYDAIADKDNDIAYIVNDVPSSESGSNYFKDLPTGSIATVNDAAELPLNALKVSVEAVQDLHGYDHPWVGGAGKNKLPLTVDGIKQANSGTTWTENSTIINGVTFTVLADNDGNITGIKVNGTPSSDAYFYFGNINLNGSYKVSGYQDSMYSRITVFVNNSVVSNIDNDDAPYSLAVTSSDTVNISIKLLANRTFTNNIVAPIVCLSTETDLTFEPYSNICPIDGLDSGEISVVGKNLFNDSEVTTGKVLNYQTGMLVNNSDYYTSDFVSVTSGNQYTFSGVCKLITAEQWWYDENKQPLQVASTNATKTVPNGACYFRFSNKIVNGYIGQIEIGNQATTYEPYQGNQYTQQFPQTIYGAEWDVVNGELGLKQTEGYFEADSIITYDSETNACVIASNVSNINTHNSYPVDAISNGFVFEGAKYLYDSLDLDGIAIGENKDCFFRNTNCHSQADYEAWISANPIQVKYKLATPIYITLTGLSIRLLEGVNNLYADCGDIIDGEYCINTSNQLCINDRVVSGDRMVPQSLVSKYSDHSTHADKADDSTHADIADNACTFSVDENGLLTISLVSGDSNNSLSSTRSVKSTTILPPEDEITNEKSEEEEVKDKSVEEEPSEDESGIIDETENAPSVEEEKDNDDGDEETPPEENMR